MWVLSSSKTTDYVSNMDTNVYVDMLRKQV